MALPQGGLPQELLPFAENIYRRFPEEFIALGMPGLEQIFDLRSNGSRTRRISETPVEKTVSITIRRWQPPAMPPQHPIYASAEHAHVGGLMMQGNAESCWGQCFPGSGYVDKYIHQLPQQSATSGATTEAQMTSQLARMEAALSTMMPQIQAAMLHRGQAPQSQQTVGRSVHVDQGATPTSGTPLSPLRQRRNVGDIRIAPPQRVEDSGAVHVQDCAVKPLSMPTPEVKPDQDSSKGVATQKDVSPHRKERERPRIIPTRIAPTTNDPESPRSPGRYSAWR